MTISTSRADFSSPPAIEYVLGFAFSHNFKEVLLIQKNRPEWQNGKLNGIGGKIEPGETPLQAMEREFQEETYFAQMKQHVIDDEPEVWRPTWTLCGTRGRPTNPGSYLMHVFACQFPIEYCVYDEQVFDSMVFVEWITPQNPEPEPEIVLRLPVDLNTIRHYGVPGLAGTVDIAAQSLREGFFFTIVDKPKT